MTLLAQHEDDLTAPGAAAALSREFWRTLPYPAAVLRRDGSVVEVNEAFLTMGGLVERADPARLAGGYNFLALSGSAAEVLEAWSQALGGTTVTLRGQSVPLREFAAISGLASTDVRSAVQDVTLFALPDAALALVAAVFVTTAVYRGRAEVARAAEYLEEHWREPVDLATLADVAGMSRTHFVRLFKHELGVTPRRWLAEYRWRMLEGYLLDPNLSVGQAFSICGLEYSGRNAGAFKERTGLPPSEWRAAARAADLGPALGGEPRQDPLGSL
ncbi:MAG: AraC family transcriptional regulator [Bifidobacteriaceae bacterium]|jgi:AraC-like DNA-binding protein|nr:AraC family transcriptional regulator [Bifidobacteriaceae bacterium]